MTATLDAQAFAREIKAAQDHASALDLFTERFAGFDNAFAYGVAAHVHAARLAEGWKPLGRKIGFTNPAMWKVYGVREPNWSYVYDRTLSWIGQTPGSCPLGRFAAPKIEPEIILHFRTAAPADGDIHAIAECVDWVAHGFEIVQSHYSGWKFNAADTTADSALHGMLFVGEPQEAARLARGLIDDLERFTVTLLCDGVERDRGTGANALGNPLRAIAHLMGVLAEQPGATPLQAGELVTTGTLTAAMAVRAGERWSTRIEGIALPGCVLECVD